MNISKVNDLLKEMGLFFISNIIGILFLGGLGLIVYTFFRISINKGFFSLGISLIIISLILAYERR